MPREESRNLLPASSACPAFSDSPAAPLASLTAGAPGEAALGGGETLSCPSAVHGMEKEEGGSAKGAYRVVSSAASLGIGMTALIEPSSGSSTPEAEPLVSGSAHSERDAERRRPGDGSRGFVWLSLRGRDSWGTSGRGSSIVLRQTSTTASPSAGMGAPQFRQNRAKSRADLPHRRQFIAHSNARRRNKPTSPWLPARSSPDPASLTGGPGISGMYGEDRTTLDNLPAL